MDTMEDPMWYRVAALRPRLRLRVRVQRRVMRGTVCYLLIDDEQRRVHRLDAAAYRFVGRLDGQITVDAAWRLAHQHLGEAAATQTEALRILAQLSDAELLTAHVLADVQAMVTRRRERRRGLRSRIANPLSFKVPLLDPARLLDRLQPLSRGVFGPWGFAVWLILIVAAAFIAAGRCDELGNALVSQAPSADFLLRMWITYPLVKLIHEACHALAVRRWGGVVREAGIQLVMLNPLPYVDASAANAFPQRTRRIAVSAVGVMAELAIAALALFVWDAASSTSVQTTALAVTAACGLSTLLFNANPLARFDGYYVLCDALDLPNLQQRGRTMLGHLAMRVFASGAGSASVPEPSRREAIIVTTYAVLAWLYQVAVVVAVSHWLYAPYPPVAAAVLLAGSWTLVLRPVGRAVGRLAFDGRLNGRRLRALGLASGATLAVVVALVVVPAPSFTVQQGVVWTPPDAIVRAEAPGELVTLFAQAGARVQSDQPIAALENLELRSERDAVAVKRLQLDIGYFNALLSDPLEAARLALDRDAMQTRLERIDVQLHAMAVRAGAQGELVMPRDSGQPGHFYRQGQDIGYILTDRPGMLVKVALTEAQAARVRELTSAVSVRLAAAPQKEWAATLQRETPGVTRTLPSAVLGSPAGGQIATDPADSAGLATVSPVALVDVQVPATPTTLLGARAWVRFDHPAEPLARQWGRALKQSFLSRLGAQS